MSRLIEIDKVKAVREELAKQYDGYKYVDNVAKACVLQDTVLEILDKLIAESEVGEE